MKSQGIHISPKIIKSESISSEYYEMEGNHTSPKIIKSESISSAYYKAIA